MQSKKMSDLKYICQFCQLTGTNHKRCSRCQNVSYCTKECQKMDWSRHRLKCKPQKKVDASDKGLTSETESKDQKTTKTTNDAQKTDLVHEEKRETSYKSDLFPLHSDTHAKNADTGNDEKPLADPFNVMNDEPLGASSQLKGKCNNCEEYGCVKRCSHCKKTYYCSEACQKNEWPLHKKICSEDMTEEDQRILHLYKVKMKVIENFKKTPFPNFVGSPSRFEQMPTFEQVLMRASRPNGSFEMAKLKTLLRFPAFEILTKFSEVPSEDVLLFQLFLGPFRPNYVLLAFMYRYHEHAMRHGVYLKDEDDNESRVEFYLDEYFDNPRPYFSYDQVKPGGYIALINPVIHLFRDDTVGIRMDHPHDVVIIDV